MSKLEMALMSQIVALKLPTPQTEYRFAMHHVGQGKDLRGRLEKAGLRDWRMDFAWPNYMLAVEVEGGGFVYGRHNRPMGFQADMQKYHHAMRLGWTIYRCDQKLIASGDAVNLIGKLLHAARGKAAEVLRGADISDAAGEAGAGIRKGSKRLAQFNQEACEVLG